MIALIHEWFGWPNGAVLTNLIASAVWVPITYVSLLRHLHCHEKGCIRPATVPIPGTVHKHCRKHALEQGHVHR
jgi:hypothetical protein